ncbi:MAG: nickel-dependent lactate racemase [Deltaproteobacteria bacterium]|nr:nickel-dependent lactate racemase [Deltaproteobacteria bacterium]
MRVELPCGHEKIDLDIPNNAMVLEPVSMPTLHDPEGAVTSALEQPIDSPPLSELAAGRKNACIVISDNTRPVPNRVILPPLLKTLQSAGIDRDQITILIATGTHQSNEGKVLDGLVGPRLAADFNIINHLCDDPREYRRIHELDGAPIEINSRYLDADLKILTGLIEPHPFAGFSGGAKSILPGLSSFETMKFMHSFKMIAHPNVDNCILQGNPFYEATLEVARLAGADFILNVVINKEKGTAGVFAGELRAAHLAGCGMVEKFSVIPIERPADLVITTGGGHPLDATFYQSTKGLIGAMPVCKKGGTVILVCGCDQGVGSDNFCELVDACRGGEPFNQKYSDPDNFILDQWAVQRYYQARGKMGDVLVVSPGIEAEQLEPFGLTKIHDLQYEVDQLLKDHSSVAVIPQGPYVVGTLEP